MSCFPRHHRAAVAALILLTATFTPRLLFAQGSLTPPGAPAPTMKTLAQIEARTPLDVANVPGDATYHHIITTPGSYYLTANLSVIKNSAIHVIAAGVTLDLNGFVIRRPAGSAGNGILIDDTAYRCTVKNGSISGFSFGIISNVPGASLSDLFVSDCTTYGIFGGIGWVIDRCQAHRNPGVGILANDGSTLRACTASENTLDGISASNGTTLTACTATFNGRRGIEALQGCTLTACTADGNATTGITAGSVSTLSHCTASGNLTGIVVGAGSALNHCTVRVNGGGIQGADNVTATGCVALSNAGIGIEITSGAITQCSARDNDLHGIRGDTVTVTGCTAAFNRQDGINTGNGATVSGCTANGNTGDGIETTSGFISRCNSRDNGKNSDGAGIHVTGSHARIEENNVSLNDRGIDVDAGSNFIVKNSASGNGTNYDIAANNTVGTIVTSPAAMNSAVNGNINVSY